MSSLGILQHDARDIRDALKSNTYNVYHRTAARDALPIRVIDARKHKGQLEVRRMIKGWVPVQPTDVIYQQ